MSYFRSFIFLTTYLFNIVFFLNTFTSIYAQPLENEMPPIFSSDNPLGVLLIFDMKKMQKGRFKAEYQPAKLVYQRENIPNVYDTVALKVRARGNSRRSICQFPPLRLNFAAKKTPKGYFSGLDKIKLASYCKNSDMYEQYILKEYYTYKL